MSMYIIDIGSISYGMTPGCTKYICGEFDSLRKAYAYAMGESVKFVTNLDIVYGYFFKKAFDLAREEAMSLSREEAEELYKEVPGIALDNCKEDAFVSIYKFKDPIDYDTVQSGIEIYGDAFLGVLLRTGAVVSTEI